MDDLKLIQERLAGVPISKLPTVAAESGVSFGALFKIKYGTTKNPRYDTVEKLRQWALKAA